MKTYEFDVKMWANVQLKAPSKAAAVAVLEEIVASLEPDTAGWNEVFESERVTILGVSVTPESSDLSEEEVT